MSKKKNNKGRGQSITSFHMSEMAGLPTNFYFDRGFSNPPTEPPPPLDLGTDEGGMLDAMENQIDSNDYMLCVVKSVTEQYERVRRDFKRLLDARKRDANEIESIRKDFKQVEGRLKLLNETKTILFGGDAKLTDDRLIEAVKNLKKRRAEKNARIKHLETGYHEEVIGLEHMIEQIIETCELSGFKDADYDMPSDTVYVLCKAHEELKANRNAIITALYGPAGVKLTHEEFLKFAKDLAKDYLAITAEAKTSCDLYDELFHAIIRMSSERTCASPTENPTHGQVLGAIENQMKDYCTLDDNERALNDRIKFAGFKKGNIMSAVNELISDRTSLGLDVKKLKKEVIDGQGYSQHWRNKYNRLYRIAYKMRLSTCSDMLQKNKENEQALRDIKLKERRGCK